jgi:hypothetical protein
MAAIEISSLSFSRGVRCIVPPLAQLDHARGMDAPDNSCMTQTIA